MRFKASSITAKAEDLVEHTTAIRNTIVMEKQVQSVIIFIILDKFVKISQIFDRQKLIERIYNLRNN